MNSVEEVGLLVVVWCEDNVEDDSLENLKDISIQAIPLRSHEEILHSSTLPDPP